MQRASPPIFPAVVAKRGGAASIAVLRSCSFAGVMPGGRTGSNALKGSRTATKMVRWARLGNTEKFRVADSKLWKINSLVLPTVAFSDFFSVSFGHAASALD